MNYEVTGQNLILTQTVRNTELNCKGQYEPPLQSNHWLGKWDHWLTSYFSKQNLISFKCHYLKAARIYQRNSEPFVFSAMTHHITSVQKWTVLPTVHVWMHIRDCLAQTFFCLFFFFFTNKLILKAHLNSKVNVTKWFLVPQLKHSVSEIK